MARNWSEHQQAIFAHVEDQSAGNAIVQAVAGSGKTTTMVEAQVKAVGTKIFLAFNKAIADELKARGVNARTFHSLCYSPVMQAKGLREVDMNKDTRLFNSVHGYKARAYSKQVRQMVGLAKQAGLGCLVPETEQFWFDMIDHHGIDFETDSLDVGAAVEMASDLLQAHIADFQMNFDDLLYMAVREDIALPKFDWVFVDEAQDTNAIQRALLHKITGDHSRVMAVGDKAQAIYGFRGADANSMELLRSEFDMVELPLTTTYRCPTSVVKYAQRWVKDIAAAPGAEEGTVRNLHDKWELEDFRPGDLIVCRTARQIITLGFKFIRNQIPAVVMGKEIGEGLKALVKKMNTTDLDELAERVTQWRDREVQKALKEDNEAKSESIYDKADAILNIIEGMPEDMRSFDQVISVLDYLFHPNANAVTLATIHKSKGLEAERVYWLNRSKCPAKWAEKEWEHQQEDNLCYVAATRAKRELYFLEEKTFTNVRAPGEVLVGETAAS